MAVDGGADEGPAVDYVEGLPSENGAAPKPADTASRSRARTKILIAVAAVAVLLLAAGAPAAVHAYDNPTAPALPGPAQNLTRLAAPGSLCQLQVTDHGAAPDTRGEDVDYAAVIHNPCPDMAVKVSILVYPVAQDGSRLGALEQPAPWRSADDRGAGTGIHHRNRQLHQHYP